MKIKNKLYIYITFLFTFNSIDNVFAINNDNIINILDYGAETNDKTYKTTKAINLAIKAAGTTKTVYIPSGTFWIKAHDDNQTEGYPTYDRGIMCQEGTKIKMEPDTYLKAIPNAKKHYSIISIFGKNNISIEGGNLVGDRNEHIGTEGEWGNGILVFGGNNLTFKNINCYDFWGDGLDFQYFYGKDGSDYDFVSNNVIIDNVHSWNNRRQGLSIEGGRNFKITNSSFNGTNGTNPQFGVDIEPAISPAIVDGIYFKNCEFKGNTGAGMGIAGHAEIKNITLENCTFKQNKIWTGEGFIGELKINNCKFINSDLEVNNGDDIEVTNNYFDDSWWSFKGITNKNNAIISNNILVIKTSRNFEGHGVRYNNLIFENNDIDFSQTDNPEKDYESSFTFYGNNLTIKNNFFKSFIAGISIKDSKNSVFENNTLSSFQKIGILLENTNNLTFISNKYHDVSYSSWADCMIYIIDSQDINFNNEYIYKDLNLQKRRYKSSNKKISTIFRTNKAKNITINTINYNNNEIKIQDNSSKIKIINK